MAFHRRDRACPVSTQENRYSLQSTTKIDSVPSITPFNQCRINSKTATAFHLHDYHPGITAAMAPILSLSVQKIVNITLERSLIQK